MHINNSSVIPQKRDLIFPVLSTGRFPNVEIADLLIQHGADVNHKSKTGATPIHGAALVGNTGESTGVTWDLEFNDILLDVRNTR